MFSFNLFTYEIKTNLDIINVVKRYIEPIEYINSVLLLMEFLKMIKNELLINILFS